MPDIRSWLYVPGDRPDRFNSALASGADAVVVDLEDAVAPERKAMARQAIATLLATKPVRPVHVRINALDAGGYEDLAALRGLPVAGLRLPKAERPQEIRQVATEAPGVPLWPLIESALGVELAFALATAHESVAGLLLGCVDLATDLGAEDPEVFDAIGVRIVIASAAAHLPRPPMPVWTELSDLTGLAEDCVQGYRRGFFGRSVLHPRHVPVVNAAFTPDGQAVAAAKAVLRHATEHGTGAGIDSLGRFTDAAAVRRAEKLVNSKESFNEPS